ncbi:hypothetical protein HanRHA438_Chr01g0044031 [Helianthus annuus]|nr:hypothetical protein HanIR_Chr01g0047681 [Helianthus annuus]KAJ0949944.1 hypothetical protein HanRHA438_Chr01g0044031 [Helianthus annuus]
MKTRVSTYPIELSVPYKSIAVIMYKDGINVWCPHVTLRVFYFVTHGTFVTLTSLYIDKKKYVSVIAV